MTHAHKTSSFVRDVGEYIDSRGLLPPRAAVVVGVSGGADSVALLAALRRLGGERARDYRLTAAHLNHGLREEAQADADFVAALAERWEIPCVVGRRDVAAEAREAGESIEQAARRARYEFLLRSAHEAGASHVAVAHHADDQAETVLYRIIRGTHLRGLAGMPALRALGGAAGKETKGSVPAGEGVVLVRPLLERTRPEVEAFCRGEGLDWRRDSTNMDVGYRRNFIRHELLPLIRERLSRRADEAILRLAAAAAEADEVLSGLARAALEGARLPLAGEGAGAGVSLDAALLAGEHPLVQAVALRIALEEAGVPMRDVDSARLGEMRRLLGGAGPAGLTLAGGWGARLREGRLLVERGTMVSAAAGGGELPDAVMLDCPGRTRLTGGMEIVCRVEPLDRPAFDAHCRRRAEALRDAGSGAAQPAEWDEWLDAGQVRGRLLCRPRRPGDRFVPLGAPGRQSVSDFLTNLKWPPPRRRSVLCVCDELGIVYVAPARLDDRVKVAAGTRECLRITASIFEAPNPRSRAM
jgi:tRNA(Ile)-lysidine synthase